MPDSGPFFLATAEAARSPEADEVDEAERSWDEEAAATGLAVAEPEVARTPPTTTAPAAATATAVVVHLFVRMSVSLTQVTGNPAGMP